MSRSTIMDETPSSRLHSRCIVEPGSQSRVLRAFWRSNSMCMLRALGDAAFNLAYGIRSVGGCEARVRELVDEAVVHYESGGPELKAAAKDVREWFAAR